MAGKVYIIDNNAYGIRADKKESRATTDGINKAIEQAKAERYDIVKLTEGDYLIECTGDRSWYPTDGIFVPTNITLDLTGARLYVAPNNSQHYALIQLDHVENATIIGGHLIGDRDQHDKSHIWGYGIQVIASGNVTIKDVKIEAMTGDGIIFTTYTYMHFYGRFPSKNVKVTGCDISACGKHGIYAIQTSGLEISDNHFHNLLGSTYQYAIDINPNPVWHSVMEQVKIHNNTFRDCTAGLRLYGGNDMEVYENHFENLSIFALYCQRVRIYKNILTETGSIYVSKSTNDRSSEDFCIPTEGELKNECSRVTDQSIKTENFSCP
ncbi:MAG: right-handed parallel beta-helix repeat-containing protein [Tannerella sp.]|nr:right-handed parallel beta-helix repeat-containing protein [Tannerella sp.]